jgi:hypothetical protein
MTQRLLFPAFTYAWLATLASAPLVLAAIWIARLQSVLEDAASYGGLVLLAYEQAILAWGIATTLAGVLTWPLNRRFLQRTGANSVAGLAYGLVIGAVCAILAAGLRDATAGDFDLEFQLAGLGETTLIGAAIGFIWAAWFAAISNWIGVYRKRPDESGECASS